jgi:hypothetical protein
MIDVPLIEAIALALCVGVLLNLFLIQPRRIHRA